VLQEEKESCDQEHRPHECHAGERFVDRIAQQEAGNPRWQNGQHQDPEHVSFPDRVKRRAGMERGKKPLEETDNISPEEDEQRNETASVQRNVIRHRRACLQQLRNDDQVT